MTDQPTPRTEAVRDALEQARLVAQWHDAMDSGPLVVLDNELGVLGELVKEAQAIEAQAHTEALDVERWEKAMRRVGMPPGDGSSWLPYVMAVAAEYEATR